MDGPGPFPPFRPPLQQPPPMPPVPIPPVPVLAPPVPGSFGPPVPGAFGPTGTRLAPAPWVPAPRPPIGPWPPGSADTGPPAGLPHSAHPLPPARSAGAGNRAFVVAVVAVIGMIFASGVVAVGYTLLDRGGFGVPVAAPGSGLPGGAAPGSGGPGLVAPAARTAPRPSGAGPGGRTPGASPSVDEVYLSALRRRPAFAGSGDADLYALGGATCARLDSGQSFVAVVGDGAGRGLQPEDTGYLMGVSVMAYCPQHKPMLERLIGRPLPSI